MRAGTWLRAAPLAAAMIVLASCGDASTPEPPADDVATAEAGARAVQFPAEHSLTPESDDDKTPVTLDARIFGSGPVGVILAHMRPADQRSWFPFAAELAQTGRFTVLTFDFRGFGESTGDKEFDRIDADLDAAYRYMRDALGIDSIYLVGASMGGTASIVLGAERDVAGVVSISSPAEFPPIDALAAVDEIDAPKLFITSADDVPAARSQERLWEAAREPKEQHTYDGNEHGTTLLLGTHAADLEARILAFLSQN